VAIGNPTATVDPLVTQLAQSGDPTLAGTLVDASSQLSTQGYGQLEQYVSQNYTGSANDNQLMNQALTQAGLSTSDTSALTNVLQTDMPAALTSSSTAAAGSDSGAASTGDSTTSSTTANTVSSDPFIASLQQSDPTMVQTLTDASSQLSTQGYGQLENYVEQNYTGNTNLDSTLMSQALAQAGLSTSDQSALTGVLQNDMPAALASDPFAASLQTSDPTMAQTLTDASNQLTPQGYQQLEQYVEQNYTGPSNDNQLMGQALTQAGLSTSDASALSNVLATDMPQAVSSSDSTTAGSDSGSSSSQPGNASIDQQIQAQLQQIAVEVQQLITELTQALGGSGGDSSGATGTDCGSTGATSTSTSPDPFIASLQTSDPTMAQTLTDASNQLTPQGYQQLEQYVEQNYTGPSNDSQLMSQALTQAGLSSADDSALQNVLATDMPGALNATPTAVAGTDSGSAGSSSSTLSGGASLDQQIALQLQQMENTIQQMGNDLGQA
jgi:hypothetical protein